MMELEEVSFIVRANTRSSCDRVSFGRRHVPCCENQDAHHPHVLHNISTRIPTGTLTAIVGLSGSGKKTLAQILAHEKQPTHGQVRYAPEQKAYKSLVYFDRDTPLHDALTVYETVHFWMRMNHSAKYGHSSIHDLVQDLVRNVQLENQQHVRVAHLSESERMRVRLAMVLATSPRTIVVDGLTTWMSAGEQQGLFVTLRKLAERNKCTIVLTVHHVMGSLLQYFHFVVLLANGYRLYSGPTLLLDDFFTRGIAGHKPRPPVVAGHLPSTSSLQGTAQTSESVHVCDFFFAVTYCVALGRVIRYAQRAKRNKCATSGCRLCRSRFGHKARKSHGRRYDSRSVEKTQDTRKQKNVVHFCFCAPDWARWNLPFLNARFHVHALFRPQVL
jgi:ABC-type multidrug transport system ATPase subunit